MKYVIKGGQWRNTEDEILKAAVMKYTLNQWSRISSLLQRPAEECKARWYEWLDPSIRKTEWTKEEEEKLLHLVKVFPSQWRTIAPIVGRTQAQCVEHYEKLLNQEQGKTKVDENDPRKLQPGEIDPNPETRPARPDPIDMDEDEKQMLAEARARLINTGGKKKNRNFREKRLEEARRLADIQKKRELKAAGIDFNIKKKIRGVDYNKEVSFERAPLQLEYATGPEEDPQLSLHFANISLQTLEGKRRDEEEQLKRKLDEKIIKKFKGRDMPRIVTKFNQLNNSLTGNKTKLVLPSPQLKDKHLEEMNKMEVRAKPGLSEIRKLIQSSLLQLPKPKNEYEVEILEVDTMKDEPNKKRLDAEEQDALDRKNNERLAASSQSARKNLPRPYKPSRHLIDSYLSRVPDEAELRKEAETLLAEEMLKMTTTDRRPLKDIFTEKDLLEADKVLKEEMLAVKELLKLEEISKEDLIKEWEEAFKNVVFDDDKQMFIDGQNLSREFKILCAINEFKEKKDRLEKEENNIETLQKKAGVSLEGYPKKEKHIQQELIGYVQNTDQCLIETEALKQVRLQEQRGSYLRMDELKELCEQLDKKEVELQKKHNKLLREREEAEKEAPAIQFI